MTTDDITSMAREAGFCGFDGNNKCLRKFAKLVAVAEREEIIKLLNEMRHTTRGGVIDAIRARGQE